MASNTPIENFADNLAGDHYLITGSLDPRVTPVSAPPGTLYLGTDEANLFVCEKLDQGMTTNWRCVVWTGPGGGLLVTQDEGIQVNDPTNIIDYVGPGIEATDQGGGKTKVEVTQAPLETQDEGVLLNKPTQILDWTGTGVTAIDAGGNKTQIIIPAPGLPATSVFSEAYLCVQSLGVSSTSSLTYVDKFTLTNAVLAGNYVIFWSAEVKGSTGNRTIDVKIDIDSDTTILQEINTDTKAVFDQYSGFACGIALGAGSHDIRMQFKKNIGGGMPVEIQRAYIMMWRTD